MKDRNTLQTKLVIIGNGADITHGMMTSYNDFREYIKMEYPGSE